MVRRNKKSKKRDVPSWRDIVFDYTPADALSSFIFVSKHFQRRTAPRLASETLEGARLTSLQMSSLYNLRRTPINICALTARKCLLCPCKNLGRIFAPWGIAAHDICIEFELINIRNRGATLPLDAIRATLPHVETAKRFLVWRKIHPALPASCTLEGFERDHAGLIEAHVMEVEEEAVRARLAREEMKRDAKRAALEKKLMAEAEFESEAGTSRAKLLRRIPQTLRRRCKYSGSVRLDAQRALGILETYARIPPHLWYLAYGYGRTPIHMRALADACRDDPQDEAFTALMKRLYVVDADDVVAVYNFLVARRAVAEPICAIWRQMRWPVTWRDLIHAISGRDDVQIRMLADEPDAIRSIQAR